MKYAETKRDYLAGEISSIQAIEALERLDWPSKNAETLVYSWDEETPEGEKK